MRRLDLKGLFFPFCVLAVLLASNAAAQDRLSADVVVKLREVVQSFEDSSQSMTDRKTAGDKIVKLFGNAPVAVESISSLFESRDSLDHKLAIQCLNLLGKESFGVMPKILRFLGTDIRVVRKEYQFIIDDALTQESLPMELQDFIHAKEFYLREWALALAPKFGERCKILLPDLVEFIKSETESARLKELSFFVIGSMGKQAVPAFATIKREIEKNYPSERRNNWPLFALAKTYPHSKPVIRELLADSRAWVRERAVKCVFFVGKPAAEMEPGLKAILATEQSLEVRIQIARTVFELGGSHHGTIETLRQALASQRHVDSVTTLIWRQAEHMAALEDEIVAAIHFQQVKEFRRKSLVRTLATLGPKCELRTADKMKLLCRDGVDSLKPYAAFAHFRITGNHEFAIGFLTAALDNEKLSRSAVVSCLGDMGEMADSAIPKLSAKWLASPVGDVYIAHSLGKMGQKALPVLQKAAQSENKFIKKQATEALKDFKLHN